MNQVFTLLLYICSISGAIQAQADEPGSGPAAISFDCRLSFPCRETTPKEFASNHKDRKVVEATLRVSANFAIPEGEVESLVYRIMLPAHVEIADYLPKTELAAEVSGTIDTERQTTNKSNMVVSFEAGGQVGYRLPTVQAEAKASVGVHDDRATEVRSSVQTKFLPPKQLIVASGTQNRGKTLYFKLRPFSQVTLEGEKEFAFLLVVPKAWAGDSVILDCTAFRKGYKEVVTHQSMGIGLYLLGDEEARARVEKLARETKTSTASVMLQTKDSRPDAIEPANLSCETCAGKFSFSKGLYDISGTFRKNGTWVGLMSFRGFANVVDAKGTWSIKDGKLTIIKTHQGKLGIMAHLEEVIFKNEAIKSFDEKAGVIYLQSGYELSR
jgi:hypothetical protein